MSTVTPELRERIIKAYRANLSEDGKCELPLADLGRRFGIAPNTVRKVVIGAGLYPPGKPCPPPGVGSEP